MSVEIVYTDIGRWSWEYFRCKSDFRENSAVFVAPKNCIQMYVLIFHGVLS